MISSPDDQVAGRFARMVSDRLGYLLKHVLARLTEAQTKALAPHGLNGRDLAVLSAVASGEPLSQLEVASRLRVDRTSIGDLSTAWRTEDSWSAGGAPRTGAATSSR